MRYSTSASCLLAIALFSGQADALTLDDEVRVYERAFFDSFSPQTALEIIERLPGFTLQEADDDRGLSLGGTNVLLNGRAITGKGEAATNQIAQITADSVIRVEILDGGSLDIPGYTGLVANIVTQNTALSGAVQWEPEFKRGSAPALANGTFSLSGRLGEVDASLALDSTAVRVTFAGPETLSSADGGVFEHRDEIFAIEGDQPTLSGSLTWDRGDGRVFNAKASLGQLDVNREQISISNAVEARGFSGVSIGAFAQEETSARFDADYTLPAFGGALKLIGVAARDDNTTQTRVRVDDSLGERLSRRGFDEDSTAREAIGRFEQSWGGDGRGWQLAGEGVFNALDLDTALLTFDTSGQDGVTAIITDATTVEEIRGELTLTHSRSLSPNADMQLSIGAETSTISQGAIEREFFRPKGFASYTLRPTPDWTLSARVAREVGQIRFRDFAASVSLFEQVATAENPELVPEQSWVLTGRAERRFSAGHIASLELEHREISDLVDRIPLGESGDAIGNIPEATQTRLESRITLLGAPFGLDGAQLDLRGSWIWSSVTDPIEGFDREIGGVRLHDLRAEFRHDVPGTDWSYGFRFQDLKLAPSYQSTLVQFRNVPGGGLTPGENAVFVERGDLFGLRVRVEVSEFLDQDSELTRVIHSGRRDIAPVDRIETRARSLRGPYLRLGVGRTF
jgi:hypothetical protein